LSEPLHIVHYPHPVLRTRSRPLELLDENLRQTVRGMFELMYAARGIGLAANQVGLPFRFFVLNLTADPAQPEHEQVFINPEIVKRHSSDEAEEGCLSLPGLYAPVQRAKRIRMKSYDLEGNLVEVEAEGLLARAIQHEIDHLDGKLFIDCLGVIGRTRISGKVRQFEKDYAAAQEAGLLAPTASLQAHVDDIRKGQGVPEPILPPRLPEAAERPSGAREELA